MFAYICLGTNDLPAAVAFYEDVLAPLGLRPQYGADLYAAYVRDPDGNELAPVCRGFTGPDR